MLDATTGRRVAVVTGGHSYDVPAFHDLWRSFAPGLLADVQHLEDWCSATPAQRARYDAVVFYIMMLPGPPDDPGLWYAGRPLSVLSELGGSRQGIVVWHHALLAYPQWPRWGELTGLADRSFGYFQGQTVTTLVAADHPITAGLAPWTMGDETYTMAEPDADCAVLLRYEQPHSMRAVAWTRRLGAARVFCYQAGHDDTTWREPLFRAVLRRGVEWTCAEGQG